MSNFWGHRRYNETNRKRQYLLGVIRLKKAPITRGDSMVETVIKP